MSSSDESLDSGAPGGKKSSKTKNPAVWGLIGVLAGSLISGAFSVANAHMAYQASENAANRAQQSTERIIEEENKRKRDEFLRDQRATYYKEFLTNSSTLEIAQTDYLTVLKQPESYPPASRNSYLAEMEVKYRQFLSSAWGMEFFSSDKLKDAARTLSQELYQRHLMLENYNGTAAGLQELDTRVARGTDKVVELRQKFADSANEILSS